MGVRNEQGLPKEALTGRLRLKMVGATGIEPVTPTMST